MKKEQIIVAARNLFTKYGYKKVSMDEIAREANVSKKTVYAYFKDKEELFKYFIFEELDKMRNAVKTIENKKLPFLEMVHETIYTVLKYKKENNFLSTITKEAEDLKNQKIIEVIKILDTEVKKYIKNKLIYAKENKFIRDCNLDVLTFVIYKVYMALIFESDLDSTQINEKDISNEIFEILKNGILIQGSE